MSGADGRRTAVAVAFFVLWIAVQAAVPILRRGRDHPTRFAWEMYAGLRLPPELVVETRGGAPVEIRASDHLGFGRVDLDWEDADLRVLCARVEGAVRVHGRWPDGRRLPRRECP